MRRLLYVLLLAILVGVGAGCNDKEGQTALAEMKAQAALEARNMEVIRTVLAETCKGNADVFQKLYAPEIKYHFPSNTPTPLSRDDEIAQVRIMHAAIPDMECQITEIFAAKDRVILRFVIQGTHTAELQGIPATGNKVTISAICIFRLKDGLVVEEVEEADMMSFYQQLGMELRPKARAK
jgi:steroid delta-isomerase-like uncharacterized protein